LATGVMRNFGEEFATTHDLPIIAALSLADLPLFSYAIKGVQ